ncbi:SGNH/GDSL hydrolase family protein [Phragmitibacter flavus]|uniref:SGNH/GDSL hydrolase family protein n=1 Tax=Phragmitibacter flavus TaxID=2576071 RepID=A0A5R8KIR2_9BACT|nr:SGNH/GDSL hydrolase family protein [Phragmitibacter flavus]TLD72208.1 SGNH/GDSL hydrolase family protein [Phragmitibacter flavus]
MRSLITLLFLTALTLHAEDKPHFNLRNGLPNFQKKLTTPGDDTRIIYFGGSITAGAGASNPKFCYRELLTPWLRQENPKARIQPYNAAIGGTGSWLGAFRCWNDVGYYRPDLVIVEFAVNDGGLPEDQVVASMEGIVRQLRSKTPSKPDILFVYTLVAGHLEDFKNGKLPPTMQYHEKVAEHYGIPSVIMAKPAAEHILSGKMTIEAFAKDNVHPTDAGYALYLESLKPFFQASATFTGSTTVSLPQPLSPRPMENARLVPYDWATLDSGWLGWQLSSTNRLPHLAVSNQPGATITLKFKGSQVGIFDLIGPDTGNLEYRINDGEWKPKARFDKYCLNSTRPHATALEQNLDPTKESILELRISEITPEGSKGRYSRLGWFLIDGEAKDPNAGLDPLVRIDNIYQGMKPVTWTAPTNRWQNLSQTKTKLANGPSFRMVMLGDSIIGDTSGSEFEHLLARDYPQTKIKKTLSVRGSTGCWWYQEENRVEEYVIRHNPDLLVIGGISQRDDIAAIRSVIHQCRAKLPNLEILLLSPTFGAPQNAHNKNWTPQPDAKAYPYRANLQTLAQEEKCGFFDMTGPWWEYVKTSGYALDSFKRDPIHANDRGKQILGRLMQRFLAPDK